ncbi:MAG: molecular chaperone DnaJ [Acidobacteria bacterium]|nr:molecular chaperone DnaJ [Acidobacteriota bacterium]
MAPQREWFEKDYYAVLGVAEGATPKEITRAYRNLAKENHPDANPGHEERFKEISAAYDVLGDAEKRKEYDEVRRMAAAGGGGFSGFGGAGGPGGGSFRVDDLGDLGDLFGNLFGGGGATTGRRSRSRGSGPQRGPDLEAELHLSFEESVQGVTTSVNLNGEATCSVCHGVGAAPGTVPRTCPTCHGRGTVAENQGVFSMSTPCPTCGGRGNVIETPCSTCHGTGVERRARSVKVRIPAGVHPGQRIRMKERGGPGRNGGPAGDLYVVVHVAKHPMFGRKADNLTITVPVTFAEAVLGADIKVPTIDGEPVTLRIPAGTRSGRTFRVKGRGVATGKGTGDLLVTTEVAVPAKLTDAERTAVEALAAATTSSPRAHLGV